MTVDNARMLNDLLALSHVPRWSIVPHYRPQSVSDHVYRTMVIAVVLAERLGVAFTVSDLLYVLYHDADESRTGDIPAPAKSEILDVIADGETVTWPDFCPWHSVRAAGAFDEVLRLADLIEAVTYIDRWGVGAHAHRVVVRLRQKIVHECPDVWLAAVDDLIRDINTDQNR